MNRGGDAGRWKCARVAPRPDRTPLVKAQVGCASDFTTVCGVETHNNNVALCIALVNARDYWGRSRFPLLSRGDESEINSLDSYNSKESVSMYKNS